MHLKSGISIIDFDTFKFRNKVDHGTIARFGWGDHGAWLLFLSILEIDNEVSIGSFFIEGIEEELAAMVLVGELLEDFVSGRFDGLDGSRRLDVDDNIPGEGLAVVLANSGVVGKEV